MFTRLPGVGKRTAERFVFYLLKSGKKQTGELALAMQELLAGVRSCSECWNFSDSSPCPICANKTRNQSFICVVAEPQDVEAIEKTGEFNGVFHVLRGTARPEEDEPFAGLKIQELLQRITRPTVKEIILALNPDIYGETTMMFLEEKIKKNRPDLPVTRLARGLPMGGDIQYADEITLGKAIKHRV